MGNEEKKTETATLLDLYIENLRAANLTKNELLLFIAILKKFNDDKGSGAE